MKTNKDDLNPSPPLYVERHQFHMILMSNGEVACCFLKANSVLLNTKGSQNCQHRRPLSSNDFAFCPT